MSNTVNERRGQVKRRGITYSEAVVVGLVLAGAVLALCSLFGSAMPR